MQRRSRLRFLAPPGSLTDGPIVRSLIRLAWPVMLANLFQTLYDFADRLWLARLGVVGVATVQLSFPLVFLVLSIAAGMTVAGIALVSQSTGAGRRDEANHAAGQVVAFIGLLSLALTGIGLAVARPLLTLMRPEPELLEAASVYLRTIYAGIPLMFGTFVITALLNGSGDTVTPMILMAVSNVVNVALDPAFIFGWGPFPEWGVFGAAFATVLSRGLVSAIGFALLFSGRLKVHLRLRDLRLRWGMVRRIVSIGGLAAIGQSGTALGFSIMNGLLARLGTAVLAAFGIGNAFISIVLMPAMGLGQATATMVGQNLGAGEPLRARQSAWAGMALSSGILVTFAVFVLALRTALIRVFVDDPEVIALGREMLTYVGVAFPFMGIIQVVNGTYQGSGRTFYSMFFELFRLWALRLPLVFVLAIALGLGAKGVWLAMFGSNLGTAILSLGFFLSGNWMRRPLHERIDAPAREGLETPIRLRR